MFGETARMATGPASLALVTGAALCSRCRICYERLPAGAPARWGTVVHFHPEVVAPDEGGRAEKIAAMTQACADALAEGIAAHPQDWHMLQRVFVADWVRLARRPDVDPSCGAVVPAAAAGPVSGLYAHRHRLSLLLRRSGRRPVPRP